MQCHPAAERVAHEVGLVQAGVVDERRDVIGHEPEIAGPRAENLVDMATLLMARRGGPVKVEGVSDPADPDHDLYENGALLPGPHATLAGPAFEEWLDAAS